ncbi:MAG: hypothetical protein U0Y10_20070 [Spirosomataceae bacterium]
MNKLVICLLVLGILIGCQTRKNENTKGQPVGDALYLEDLLNVKNHEELVQRFGAANVKKDTMIPGPEGTTLKGTLLFPGTDDEVEVYWANDSTYESLRNARILAKFNNSETPTFTTRWQSRSGLKLGLNLAQVLELNEKDFLLSGLGWDYGGYVSDWQKGKLDEKQLQARFIEQGNNQLTEAESSTIMGDQSVSSSAPALKKITLVVSEVGVYVPSKE